jgi:hypothetical protein
LDLVTRPARTGLSATLRRLIAARGGIFDHELHKQATIHRVSVILVFFIYD